ncbi:hypothetical protein B0T24DRAFT_656315 [Lasiosphaeria ovina]|uniref:DUF8021 domain-containing protein n=1 Tax=Lasiosphaeria ovina TaxID=92902 RepID=A0AAE0NB69_9PEZI|nr:hypothetical protein B0T24DRAFT_656315 [Lasiosphaeria ovina]
MYSFLLTWAGLAAGVSAACTRAALQDATATYLKAQAAGQPSLLAGTLASNASYAENDAPVSIAASVLAQALTIDFSRSIYDTTECASFTEITSATSPHPYIIHTRLLFSGAAPLVITAIESVVTDAGDWAFNATAGLSWTLQETWDAIPAAQRDTRAVIQAAADAYLDQWGNPDLPVPLGTPCARLEGGSYYSGAKDQAANTCAMGAFPVPLAVGHRRYVVDEELGAVDVFNGFPWLESTRAANFSTPSSNFVRVVQGKIRYIHEATVCQTPNCGR